MVTGLADDAARAVFTEFDEFLHDGDLRQFSFDFFQCVGEGQLTAEVDAVQLFDHRDGFRIEPGTLQADFVDR